MSYIYIESKDYDGDSTDFGKSQRAGTGGNRYE